jgi:ABC-type branched-subunit amino acid transport system ATPase component
MAALLLTKGHVRADRVAANLAPRVSAVMVGVATLPKGRRVVSVLNVVDEVACTSNVSKASQEQSSDDVCRLTYCMHFQYFCRSLPRLRHIA